MKFNFEADGKTLVWITGLVCGSVVVLFLSYQFFKSGKDLSVNKKQELDVSLK
jgi:hypothetical protein